MGTPKNPEVLDTLTLFTADGTPKRFSVAYVDDGFVHLESMGGHMEHFMREQFEQLFEDELRGEGDGE